jgi:hypothetical protein
VEVKREDLERAVARLDELSRVEYDAGIDEVLV